MQIGTDPRQAFRVEGLWLRAYYVMVVLAIFVEAPENCSDDGDSEG